MKCALVCYPQAQPAAQSITVQVERQNRQLDLTYCVMANPATIKLPSSAPVARRDELWKHTCAELFVAVPDHAAYCEFNFSPSTQWAAYEFDDYRAGMRELDIEAPRIAVTAQPDAIIIKVACALPHALAGAPSLQAGITLVLEDQAGHVTYWALAHPADKPDFHHRAGFVLEL